MGGWTAVVPPLRYKTVSDAHQLHLLSKGNEMTHHAGSPLKEIIERIRTTRSLTLDATILGEKQFDLLKRIFPHQKDFVLSNCENLAPTNLSLTFTGEFAELFPWQKVPVEVCFFDQKTE